MKRLLFFLAISSIAVSNFDQYFDNSIWKKECSEIFDYVKTIVDPRSMKAALEFGMDFGCVIHFANTFPDCFIQSIGLKKGTWQISKALGNKVAFSRMDTRVLHEGKKPHYGLIIVNGNHAHRIMDLGFAFKHAKYFLVSNCDAHFANAKKHLDIFLDKNKHVKVLKYWSHGGGILLLGQ